MDGVLTVEEILQQGSITLIGEMKDLAIQKNGLFAQIAGSW